MDFNAVACEQQSLESESITTDGQSASLSWNKHPSGAYDQIFITVSCGFFYVGRSL
jgi:hypothetical protein